MFAPSLSRGTLSFFIAQHCFFRNSKKSRPFFVVLLSGYYGLTKAAAIKKGIDAEEGKAPYTSCLRGRVFAPQGFLKLVFEKGSGVIIGVHILGTSSGQFNVRRASSKSFSLPLPRIGSIRDIITDRICCLEQVLMRAS